LPEASVDAYLGYLRQWTHNLNLLRSFPGDIGGQTRVKGVHLDTDGMTGIVILDVNGVRAVVESAYTKFHAWEEHTQIYTTNGWLRTAAPPLMHKETPATVEIYRSADGDEPPCFVEEIPPVAWSYREEAKHFLHCVRSGETFHSSAEDTLHDVQLCEDIYRGYLEV
jgi:predicted dehydrogenase